MNPLFLQAGISIVEAIIAEIPELKADFQTLFSKTDLTPADLQAFRAHLASENYGQFVPNTDLPPAQVQ